MIEEAGWVSDFLPVLLGTAAVVILIFIVLRVRSNPSGTNHGDQQIGAGSPGSEPQPQPVETEPSAPRGSQATPQAGEVDKRDFFISHAVVEADTAMALVEALESKGKSCWIAPRDIAGGERYADAIAENLAHRTHAVIVLYSPAAEASDAVFSELDLAKKYNQKIIPIMLFGHSPQTKGASYYLGTSQWLRVDGHDPDAIQTVADQLAR